jgi:glycosyltransferase involved in cell wall biosynthesis
MAEAYRKADVFVFPSWIEGYGLPPLEAMACGVPVVTTDCGGIRDFAEDGVNALITLPRKPRALAEAILRLLKDRPLVERLASNGLATSRKLTWDRFVEQVEQAFLRVLDSR